MEVTRTGGFLDGGAARGRPAGQHRGGFARGYRALQRRLSDALGRGDPDYSALTALAQEIGRLRLRIRRRLERRLRRRT
jgi:hypothetical protein